MCLCNALVQQGDGINEGEVFLVIAPRAGAFAGEGELLDPRVPNREAFQKALGVAVDAQEVLPGGAALDPGEGAGSALQFVDAAGLRRTFIDGQGEAAVLQFLVDVDGGCC